MKPISKILMLLCGAATLFSCEKKGGENPPVIDLEHHYSMVYMLGAAADNHWDSADPLPMTATDNQDVFEYELELVRSTENKLLKFCLNVATWDKAEYLVPVAVEEGQADAFLKEGVNDLVLTSEAKDGVGNLKDWFFGIAAGESGRYKIEVNPIELTMTATKLESLPDPEITEWVEGNLYMVGDATPNGWEIGNPTPMVRDGDIHTYEGNLAAGEMKIVAEFKWESDTYRPAVAATEISESGITDGTVVLDPGGSDPDDKKWKVVTPGKYRLTLNTADLTLDVEWLGE